MDKMDVLMLDGCTRKEAEKNLDIEDMVEQGVAGTEEVEITPF